MPLIIFLMSVSTARGQSPELEIFLPLIIAVITGARICTCDVRPGLMRGQFRVAPSPQSLPRSAMTSSKPGGGRVNDPAEMIDITSMRRKLRLFRSGNKFVAGKLGVYPTFDRSFAGISSSYEVRPASMRPHIVQQYQRFKRAAYHSISCDAKSYLYGFAPLIVRHFVLPPHLPITQTPSLEDTFRHMSRTGTQDEARMTGRREMFSGSIAASPPP